MFPSQANSDDNSNEDEVPGRVNATFHNPVGRRRPGIRTAIPPSLKSVVVTLMVASESTLRMRTGICTVIRELRRRSRFIKARAARKLALARSVETGLYKTKCAPRSNAERRPVAASTTATATARLLHSALRALRKTSAERGSAQSTMIASKRSRVSLRNAASASEHSSTPISRSPRVRRSTRTILSSAQSTSDFRVMDSHCLRSRNSTGWEFCESNRRRNSSLNFTASGSHEQRRPDCSGYDRNSRPSRAAGAETEDPPKRKKDRRQNNSERESDSIFRPKFWNPLAGNPSCQRNHPVYNHLQGCSQR